jgi:hypothetical protein
MSWVQEISAENLAKLLHFYQQALATDCHDHLDNEQKCWERMPAEERKTLVAAARLSLLDLGADPLPKAKPYFAEPGQAEWGC